MALDVRREKGVPLDRQQFTWRELAGPTISKLDDDALTRVRIILMSGVEGEAVRFQHACARTNGAWQLAVARIRRIEQHQQTMVSWLLPADQSPLETTIAYEQAAIELTAAAAEHEPDPYLAQVYRFGMLEDFDHLYRYAAMMDRLEGRDANNILQSYTDILPGRPTEDEHRAAADDLRRPYDRKVAAPLTKLHALTVLAGEHQSHDYYMAVGPQFADPVARQLYAEIASVEEQHVTQYESLCDPTETWLERWLLHELTEAYNYWSCMQREPNARVRAVWERFLDYELGHLRFVAELLERTERRDAATLVPAAFPDPIDYTGHRDFVRQTLTREVDLRPCGADFVPRERESIDSIRYREELNAEGSPSDTVAQGYRWLPGTELTRTLRATGT